MYLHNSARWFCLALWLFASVSTMGDDWPNWRGPTRNGISAETNWRKAWDEQGPNVIWKANIGTGFSSMSVKDGRLYTMGHANDSDTVYCLNAEDGQVIWKHSYESPLDDRFFEGGPTSTPSVDADRVYSMGRQGDLFCFDAISGKVRWSKNVSQETGVRVPGWGFSSSPLVHDDRLVLNVGQSGMAINKHTGELLWTSGDSDAGYMTPYPIQIEERWFALIASSKFYQCVDLETGEVAWKHRWLTTNGCNAADPIVQNNRAFISSGYGRGAALLSFDATSAQVIWANTEMQNQLNSSVLAEGFIFGFDGDEGGEVQLKCLDFSSGKVLWSFSGLGAGSLAIADNHLIVLSEDGELSIAPVSNILFKPIVKAKILEGKCWTVPVLSNGKIYCRNAAGDLACVNVSP